MTRMHERLETDLPIEATFDFIADFANAHAWDPGTAWSRRTEPADRPIGVGTTLRARRPDGRPGRADDLPDHAASSARPGSSSSATGSGVDVGRRHPVRAERRRDRHRLRRRHPPAGPPAAHPAVPRRHVRADRARMPRPGMARPSPALAAPERPAGGTLMRVAIIGAGDQRPQRRLRAPPRPRHRALRRGVADRRPRQDRRRRDRLGPGRGRHGLHRPQRRHLPDVPADARRARRRDPAERHEPGLGVPGVRRGVQLARRPWLVRASRRPRSGPATGGCSPTSCASTATLGRGSTMASRPRLTLGAYLDEMRLRRGVPRPLPRPDHVRGVVDGRGPRSATTRSTTCCASSTITG